MALLNRKYSINGMEFSKDQQFAKTEFRVHTKFSWFGNGERPLLTLVD